MDQRTVTDDAQQMTNKDALPETPRILDTTFKAPKDVGSDLPKTRLLMRQAATTPREGRIDAGAPTPRGIIDTIGPTYRPPPTKRRKTADDESHPETTVILAESSMKVNHHSTEEKESNGSVPKLPVRTVTDRTAGSSSPSDLSSSSLGRREAAMSPVTPYVPEVPRAPPSTPASDHPSTESRSGRFDGLSTPLPNSAFKNAVQLEQQQELAEGAVTPAPTKTNKPTHEPNQQSLSDDFSEWAVGDRYQMLRTLGRGSYGEVAQAIDLYQGRSDAYVAIKRIQSPFDQEVDAVRLFREIHILRRMRGHECVIQLLDIVEPPSDDLDDFHDLYLVFECK